MSKQKKKIPSPAQPMLKTEREANLWNTVEAYLNKNVKFVLGGLLLAGIILRVIYFIQLNNTPCISYHLYEQSDMNFFDKWAKHLEQEDWLQHTSYNNFTNPQQVISEAYLNKYPQTIDDIKKRRAPGTEANFKELGKALFNKWGGDKVYFQDPLFVYVVAFIYKIFGPDVRYFFILQLLIGLGSIVLIFLITRDYFGNLAALIAGLAALLHGPLMFYELVLLRETMIVFAGLLLVYVIGKALKNKTPRNLFFTGIIIGFCILIKSIFIIFGILFLVLIYFDSGKTKPPVLKDLSLTLAGLFTAMLPLIIRNLIVGVSPFAISGNLAYNFLNSNYYGFNPELGLSVAPTLADIFYKTNASFLPSFKECLNTFPSFWDYLNLLWQKFKLVFLWVEIPNNKSFYYYKLNAPVLNFTFVTFTFISALGFPGMVLSFFRKNKPWSLYLLIFTHFAVLIGFLVLSRFRIPLTAALIPFCGLAVSDFFRKAELKNVRTVFLAVFALVLFFIVNRPLPKTIQTIRSSDYIVPYYFYYKPKIDSSLAQNRPAEGLKLMENFFSIKPEELDNINRKTFASNPNYTNMALAYVPVYKVYSKLALANNMKAESEKLKVRAQELASLADTFGTVIDVFTLVRKARVEANPVTKTDLLKKAVAELMLRIKSDPKDLESYGTIADIMLNDFHDSTQYELYMHNALIAIPDNPRLQFNLGRYYIYSMRNIEEGKRLIEASLKGWSDNSQAYTDLGNYYSTYRQYEKAKEYWHKAVALNPADSNATINLRRFKNINK